MPTTQDENVLQARQLKIQEARYRDLIFEVSYIPSPTVDGSVLGFTYRGNLKAALAQMNSYRSKGWGPDAFRVAFLSMQLNGHTVPIYLPGCKFQPLNEQIHHMLLIIP